MAQTEVKLSDFPDTKATIQFLSGGPLSREHETLWDALLAAMDKRAKEPGNETSFPCGWCDACK